MAHKLTLPNFDDIIERYRAGESANALADELGIARKTLKSHLLDAGVEVRGRAGSVAAKMSTLSDTERAAWLARLEAGPAALRGTDYSDARLRSHAAGRAGHERWITAEERLLAEWLPGDVVHQPAVGRYNADLMLSGTVAVEVQRSDHTSYHRTRWAFLQRLDYILDLGQAVAVILWNTTVVLHPIVATELIAFAEITGRNPSSRGQYRVIWGDGKYVSRGDHDIDELARIWPTKTTMRARSPNASRP